MPTLDQLNKLSEAIPVMNQKAATRIKNQNASQAMNSAVGANVPGMSATKVAQTVAPQAIAADAQANVQASQQTTTQLNAVGNMGLQVQASDNAANLAAQQQTAQKAIQERELAQKLELSRADIAMRKKITGAEMASATRVQALGIEQDNKLQALTIRQREQLSRLGGDVRDKIVDSRLRFERDDMGRKFTNDRQLADYATQNSHTEQVFKERQREVEQVSVRKVQMMQMAERRMREMMTQGFEANEQQLNNESKSRIANSINDMNARIRREQARANNRMAMWKGGGMIVGAVIGAAVSWGAGTAAGAAAGATIGSGVGQAVGGQQESQRSDNSSQTTGQRPGSTQPQGSNS